MAITIPFNGAMMITSHKTTLANGLRLVTVEMPHLHSAEIAIYIKVGGRHDSRDRAGLAHFLEHMFFRGTEEHATTLELERAFEALGGSVNAATDAESTCYYTRLHPDHVAEGLRLLGVMLLKPTFQGIDIEKRIITEEALEDLNEKGEEINADNLASRLLWPDHPLGMPTIGYLEAINAFTVDDLRRHMDCYYVPENALVVVAGRVGARQVETACAEAFGSWAGGRAPQQLPAPAVQTAPQSVFVKDSDSQVVLQLAFRGPSRFDSGVMATRLLRRVLCGGGSSRLHLLLREKLGIVYSVDANLATYDETGCFAIELSTARENLVLAVTELLRETLRVATEPFPEDELRKVRDSYLFDLEYSKDSTFDMQARYGWGALMEQERTIEEDQEAAHAVTSDDIREAARSLFAPGNLNLVAVGPWQAAARRQVERLLANYVRDYARLFGEEAQ